MPTELAEGDLAEIWVSIALDNMEVADRLIEELRDKAVLLAEQPPMGVARLDFGTDVRSFPHRDYLVIYRLPLDRRSSQAASSSNSWSVNGEGR